MGKKQSSNQSAAKSVGECLSKTSAKNATTKSQEAQVTPRPVSQTAKAERTTNKMRSFRQAIAAIEPAPSPAQRCSRKYRLRATCLELWHETPSWLTSLVMHLSFLIVLGSLMRPNTPNPGVNLLVLSSAVDAEPSAGDLVVFAQDIRRDDGGDEGGLKDPAHLADNVETVVPGDVDVAAPDSEPTPQLRLGVDAEMLAESSETAPETTRHESESEAATTEDVEASHIDGSIVQVESENPFAVQMFSVLANATSVSTLAEMALPPSAPLRSKFLAARTRHDEVVERFIEYDIGNLRGTAGEMARRDFNYLGPEAIPALVRGLNKSASIAASCPVGVISSKLQYSLGQTHDPSMIQYALDNLGQGVKETDPHAKRVLALRDQLQNKYVNSMTKLRQQMAKHGLPTDDGFLLRYRQLNGASSEQLIEVLQDWLHFRKTLGTDIP
jgi:hypothetical protein